MRTAIFILVPLLVAGCDASIDPRLPDGNGSDASTITPGGDAGPICHGNGDGVITRDELVFAPGIDVRYRINPIGTNVTVDVNGQAHSDGSHAWDFSNTEGELDSLQLVTTAGLWFAGDFPTGEYASRIDPRGPTLGVYHATDVALELLGVANEDMTDGTELRYDTPIPLLRFPLVLGMTWSADAMTSGMAMQVPVASRDHYDVTVDASGSLNLGILTLRQTLRVRVESTQMFPAGPGTRRIQYLWLTECYGEVARITSTNGEVDPSFTQAEEFRRLGL